MDNGTFAENKIGSCQKNLTSGTPSGPVCSHDHSLVMVKHPVSVRFPLAWAIVTTGPPSSSAAVASYAKDSSALASHTCFAGTVSGISQADSGAADPESPPTALDAADGADVGL